MNLTREDLERAMDEAAAAVFGFVPRPTWEGRK